MGKLLSALNAESKGHLVCIFVLLHGDNCKIYLCALPSGFFFHVKSRGGVGRAMCLPPRPFIGLVALRERRQEFKHAHSLGMALKIPANLRQGTLDSIVSSRTSMDAPPTNQEHDIYVSSAAASISGQSRGASGMRRGILRTPSVMSHASVNDPSASSESKTTSKNKLQFEDELVGTSADPLDDSHGGSSETIESEGQPIAPFSVMVHQPSTSESAPFDFHAEKGHDGPNKPYMGSKTASGMLLVDSDNKSFHKKSNISLSQVSSVADVALWAKRLYEGFMKHPHVVKVRSAMDGARVLVPFWLALHCASLALMLVMTSFFIRTDLPGIFFFNLIHVTFHVISTIVVITGYKAAEVCKQAAVAAHLCRTKASIKDIFASPYASHVAGGSLRHYHHLLLVLMELFTIVTTLYLE